MNIEINKARVETVRFGSLKPGSLFRHPSDGEACIQIKNNELVGVSLLNGDVDDNISTEEYVVDVTNEYKLVNA